MPEPLHKDFKEFLESLIEKDVRFLVVGGYAVTWHGRPRNTEDIDIFIDRSEDNAKKITEALENFGALEKGKTDSAIFTHHDRIFQMGLRPWKIDIFTHIPGVEFSACYENRVFWEISELRIPMISLYHTDIGYDSIFNFNL